MLHSVLIAQEFSDLKNTWHEFVFISIYITELAPKDISVVRTRDFKMKQTSVATDVSITLNVRNKLTPKTLHVLGFHLIK